MCSFVIVLQAWACCRISSTFREVMMCLNKSSIYVLPQIYLGSYDSYAWDKLSFFPSILACDMFAVINGARSFLSAKREGSVEFEAETWIICLRGSHSQTTENFGAFTMSLRKRPTKRIFTKYLNAHAERFFRFRKSYISPPSHYRRRRRLSDFCRRYRLKYPHSESRWLN